MIDNPQPTLANGRFDCPICGKPATSYMLGYDAKIRRQVATYTHREVVNSMSTWGVCPPAKIVEDGGVYRAEWECKAQVLHG